MNQSKIAILEHESINDQQRVESVSPLVSSRLPGRLVVQDAIASRHHAVRVRLGFQVLESKLISCVAKERDPGSYGSSTGTRVNLSSSIKPSSRNR
jgi:hypothetical protein